MSLLLLFQGVAVRTLPPGWALSASAAPRGTIAAIATALAGLLGQKSARARLSAISTDDASLTATATGRGIIRGEQD